MRSVIWARGVVAAPRIGSVQTNGGRLSLAIKLPGEAVLPWLAWAVADEEDELGGVAATLADGPDGPAPQEERTIPSSTATAVEAMRIGRLVTCAALRFLGMPGHARLTL